MNNSNTLTYKQNMNKAELFRILKAIVFPLLVFGFGLFTISSFANFGTKLICPASGIMWVMGVITAILLPSMRKEVLSQTLVICVIYYAVLLGFKMALSIVSGVSSEMIAASYDQAIPLSTGNAMPGYLQNMLWFSAILIPVGQIGMQGKRLMQFRKTRSLHQTFDQKRSLRKTNNGNTNMS